VILADLFRKLMTTVKQFLRCEKNDVLPGYWCLVGNIIERTFEDDRGVHQGTKQFSPGTRVYCFPAQWGDGYDSAVAVGLSQRSRRLITVVIQTKFITNWRAKQVFKPSVLRHSKKVGRMQMAIPLPLNGNQNQKLRNT
jgi:hypothetical protein